MVRSEEFSTLPRRARARFSLLRSVRLAVVVVAVLGVSYTLIAAVWSGPPHYADPLTTSGVYSVHAGSFAYIGGSITGEDYIVGNYSVVAPTSGQVQFSVYNTTEFIRFAHHQPSVSQWSIAPQGAGRIVFAAPYTDVYYLVWSNPNPGPSGVDLTVFASTNYMSNVVIG